MALLQEDVSSTGVPPESGKALSALEALYDRHHRLVLAIAVRVLGDRESAEDVAQESFSSR